MKPQPATERSARPPRPAAAADTRARAGRWWQRLVNAGVAIWLLWQLAPLLVVDSRHPLDPPLARVGLLLALLLLLIGLRALLAWQARQRNRRLLQDLQQGMHDTDALLRERFAQAMRVLRDGTALAPAGQRRWWRLKRHVYQLPWYLFIGAPGAGKTTALLNAGLHFPLASTTGQAPLTGIGGTRHCDWWFTAQAVFIDTAGRYTTQDSDHQADAGEWRGFLGLLRRHRPAQPINGVIVTVSVPDLLQGGQALQLQARSVAQRLQELRATLQQRFPVYLLVTKTDLLAGFSEFFGRCDALEREQVWGIGYRLDAATPSGAAPAFDSAAVSRQVHAMAERLYHLTPTRLQEEQQPQRRVAIYHFAAQLEALAAPLQDFVGSALRHCGEAPRQDVRGIFLSSGTQEGNPIDRVLSALTRGFGVAVQALPRPDGAGKAYFLAQLLREGVIGEAALAGTNLQRQRRRRGLERSVAAALALLLLAACALWAWSSRNNQRYLEGARERVEQISQRIRSSGDRPAVERLLPLYAILRDLAFSGGVDPGQAPPGLGWGLFQGPRLAQSAAQTYHHVLDLSLAPLLAGRLGSVLADDSAAPALRYEALRVHQMLMQPQHLRREAVRAWADRAFALDASAGGISAGERQEWLQHLDALLERNAVLESVRVDAAALRSARAALQAQPLAQRAYARLLAEAFDTASAAADGPGGSRAVTLAELAGADAALLFTARQPGQALPAIPAPYSARGWQRLIRPAWQASLARTVEEQGWVLGQPADAGRVELETLADEVLRLYAQDYAGHWDRLFDSLALEPLADGRDTPQALARLVAPDSALRRLLAALGRELQPGNEAEPVPAGGAAGATPDPALNELLGARYAPLLDHLQGRTRDDASGLLDQAGAAQAGDSGNQAARLHAAARHAPLPLATFWSQLAQQFERQQVQRVRAELGDALAELSRRCLAITADRYPFVGTGRSEVSLADFSRLLGPLGLLDGFFLERLAPLVDRRQHPWRWHAAGQPPSAAQARALQAFEQAQQLRELFFSAGAATPQLRLRLVPVELDPALFWFSLDVDGQSLRYENGPRRAKSLLWPAAGPASRVMLRVPRPDTADTATEIHDGSWALLRVLTRQPWSRAGAGVVRVRVGHEGLGLGLALDLRLDPGSDGPPETQARAPADPWPLGQMGQFKCPLPW